MNAMIPVYVYTRNFVATRLEALKERTERGAGLVEYAGLIVLAAILLGAIYAAVKNSQFTSSMLNNVKSILSGQGNGKGVG